MPEEDKKKVWDWFIGLSQGQVYAYIGILIVGATFFGSDLIEEYIQIRQEQMDRAFWFGCALWGAGTGMHIYRTFLEGKSRRSGERKIHFASPLSIELAKTITRPMTMQEISDHLPGLPYDELKTEEQAKAALKRARIREAAKDGEHIYEHNGQYFPRNMDHTVIVT